MQIHWGSPPESEDFQPEAQGWSGIREPGPIAMQFLAVPIASLVLTILGGLIYLTVPREVFTLRQFRLARVPVLIILVGLTPVHELIHVFVTPGLGLSPQTFIGIWPARLLIYAHYEGIMSRNHFLWVFATPLLLLSVVPTGIIVLLNHHMSPNTILCLAILAITNGAAASGDILGIGLVAAQIPKSALVRNKGWKSYWKLGA